MKLCVIYTGGTIGCTGQPLSPLSGQAFATAFADNITPIIKAQYPDCSVNFMTFASTLDSTNLQPSDWCRITKDILTNYTNYDAFIILHGTDSMAWTASALSFLLTGLDEQGRVNARLSKPVIVTGSQLPLFKQTFDAEKQAIFSMLNNTDALDNICGSVATAYTKIAEVLLYFGNTLIRGNRAVKTSVSEFKAFTSPNYPVLGKYDTGLTLNKRRLLTTDITPNYSLENQTTREQLIQQLNYISQNIYSTNVLPILAYPAHYDTSETTIRSVIATMLSTCIDQGVNGIILESYGAGNFPAGNSVNPESGAVYKALEKAHQKGVVIVNCTQVLQGAVNSSAYASGSWLTEVGAIGAKDMTPTTALSKLIYLLSLKGFQGNNWKQENIERLISTNIIGEIGEL